MSLTRLEGMIMGIKKEGRSYVEGFKGQRNSRGKAAVVDGGGGPDKRTFQFYPGVWDRAGEKGEVGGRWLKGKEV